MTKSHAAQRGTARIQQPERHQVRMWMESLDKLVSENHVARLAWSFAESLDLSDLYSDIKAVEGHAGRSAIDPRVLFALWLLATIEGNSSARRLSEATERDLPYMWICGGEKINYHTLADFRTSQADLLERVLSDSIAALLQQGLITLDTVGQDGMRVRANAGAGSFRREKTLQQAQAEADEHLRQLKKQHAEDPSGGTRRERAARERAARERAERIAEALRQIEVIKAGRDKKKRDNSRTRASTTDPDARRMKMGDGGFRPALNVQLATDGETRVIVGADVISSGSDAGQMGPMFQELIRFDILPNSYLVDTPFATIDDVTTLEKAGTKVYAPLQHERKQLEDGKDPYARKKRDTDEMATFRARMGTPEGKETYRQRPSIAEFPNAEFRNRGLQQFRVRGIAKAKAQVLWHALAFNLLRFRALNFTEALGIGK